MAEHPNDLNSIPPGTHPASQNTAQAVTLVFTAAVFLVAGLLIAMILNSGDDGLSDEELRDAIEEAVGTQIAASAPLTAGDGSSSLSEQEFQAMIDQAVGTQVAALRPTSTPVPPTPTVIPLASAADDDAFLGPEDAPVVIVEFSDFQCGFCNRWAQETLPLILEEYPDEVRFVYRDFTIFGEDSVRASMATECAEEQDAFWDMHNVLFDVIANQEPDALSEDSLVSYAGELGIDEESFRECLTSDRYLDEVVADSRAAQTWGLRGTPGFVINGVVYTIGAQPFEVSDGIIQGLLDESGAIG